MNNLDILKKQHGEVLTMIQNIEALSKPGLEAKVSEIAYNINALSGKLKMHLMSEDQFLYPALMKSGDTTVRDTAQDFNKEMGNLPSSFNSFIQQYNTPIKITQHRNSFAADSKNIFRLITERIHNEDEKLYPLIDD